mgnify:CR=1 FL=1
MRLILIADGRVCTELRKNFKNLSVSSKGILYQRIQLPSEKVPAPPSPNCTLDAGFNTPFFQKASTRLVLASTSSPRSKRMGQYPFLASIRPQNSPAGPVPIITGGYARGEVPHSGRQYGFSWLIDKLRSFFFLTMDSSLFEPPDFKVTSTI